MPEEKEKQEIESTQEVTKVEEVPSDEVKDAKTALRIAGIENPTSLQIQQYISQRFGDTMVSQEIIEGALAILKEAGLTADSTNVQALINAYKGPPEDAVQIAD